MEIYQGTKVFINDPENTIGAMFQGMFDTGDEEGTAFCVGYATEKIVEVIVAKKVADAMAGPKVEVDGAKRDVITSKGDILAQNRINGRAFEREQFEVFSRNNNNAVEQVTIKTNSGVRTRVDAIGLEPNGHVVINEYKSTPAAPLTPNQKIAFPEITDHLDWEDEYQNLILLQEKINAYIGFCEKHQYSQIYKDVQVEYAIFEIHFKNKPTEQCMKFLEQVQKQVQKQVIEIGITLECHIIEG